MYDVVMAKRSVVAEKVEEAMRVRGMTAADLSRLSGVSESAISNIASGKRTEPRSDTVRKLAQALEVSADYLQGTTDDPAQADGEPWPEYALEVLESMRQLDSAQNYTLLVTARALIEERESLRHLSVVDLVQAAADYYGGGAELKRFEEQLKLLEARRGVVGRITAAEESKKPAQE